MTTEDKRIQDFLIAVEFGFRQCEKGSNLEVALANAKAILSTEAPMRSVPNAR